MVCCGCHYGGLSHEVINGQEHLAAPGMALLLRPGDVMQGCTSEAISGVSIVPPDAARPLSMLPLITFAISTASIRERLRGARSKRAGSWGNAPPIPGQVRASLPKPWWMPCTSGRSAAPRLKVANASVPNAAAAPWPMPANGWSVTNRSASARRKLSCAVHVSVRSLQYGSQEELGCTPMAHAKRLRLRRLRRSLQDQHHRGVDGCINM